MLAEVGLVGNTRGNTTRITGKHASGTRIPRMYRENISEDEIFAELDTLIGAWAKDREADESFGDFVIRTGVVKPVVNSAEDFATNATVTPLPANQSRACRMNYLIKRNWTR